MACRSPINTDSSNRGGAVSRAPPAFLANRMSKPDFDKSIAALTAEFSRSGIAELAIRQGDFELYLSNRADDAPGRHALAMGGGSIPSALLPRPQSRPSGAEAARKAEQAIDVPPGAMIVTAPNLGTFYRAPKPGAAPYVEVGAEIAEGDELCLIEVMKLFTAVRAEAAGRLHSILAEDGSMVEAGQPLFALVES